MAIMVAVAVLGLCECCCIPCIRGLAQRVIETGMTKVMAVRCNATSAGIQLSLQVTRCQLKNRRLYKALPPPHQRKSARLLSVTEQREVTGTFLKDIRSFHDY